MATTVHLNGSLQDDGKESVRYQGYIVDLMDRISSFLGLPYHLSPVSDGEYGHQTTDSSWNGMIRKIIDRVGPVKN